MSKIPISGISSSIIIISLDNNGLYLRSIPCILDGYAPLLEQLPQLLFDLASNVVYDEVENFFKI